ncbi:MAG: hypothetical protein ACN4GZ_13330 [Acidimicrobiales bacterium]
MPDVSTRLVLSIGLIVVAVGALDSLISREWDLLVVFVLSGLVQLGLWLRQSGTRSPVSLRPDLARWLADRSEQSGEPFEDLLDRAVARYQHGLYGEPVDGE